MALKAKKGEEISNSQKTKKEVIREKAKESLTKEIKKEMTSSKESSKSLIITKGLMMAKNLMALKGLITTRSLIRKSLMAEGKKWEITSQKGSK